MAGPRGFTPTRLGKTHSPEDLVFDVRVHPHACGEDAIERFRLCHIDGSPPRVWGRLLELLLEVADLRFTPTRVGKTPAAA